MLKNIIILFLVGMLAFLFISSRNSRNSSEVVKTNDVSVVSESSQVLKDTPKKATNGEILDLSNSALSKLPSNVLDKANLVELDISNNNLTGALPAEIRQLRNLRVLDASNNQMTGVPAEIGQLEKLEVLNLANNKLTGLPYELGNLKNLKTLNLSGNNYAKQDLEIIKQGLSSDVEIIL